MTPRVPGPLPPGSCTDHGLMRAPSLAEKTHFVSWSRRLWRALRNKAENAVAELALCLVPPRLRVSGSGSDPAWCPHFAAAARAPLSTAWLWRPMGLGPLVSQYHHQGEELRKGAHSNPPERRKRQRTQGKPGLSADPSSRSGGEGGGAGRGLLRTDISGLTLILSRDFEDLAPSWHSPPATSKMLLIVTVTIVNIA